MICLIYIVAPFVDLDTDMSIEVVTGKSISLSVSISGFNLPLTSITWSQPNGTEDRVTIAHTHTLPATTGPVQSTLHLRAALPQDSGNYSITASNGAGSGTAMFTLAVKGKP